MWKGSSPLSFASSSILFEVNMGKMRVGYANCQRVFSKQWLEDGRKAHLSKPVDWASSVGTWPAGVPSPWMMGTDGWSAFAMALELIGFADRKAARLRGAASATLRAASESMADVLEV